MRIKFLVAIVSATIIALSFSFPKFEALSQFPEEVSLTFEKPLTIEVSPPTKGTVIFKAETDGIPASGVEIRIDGESKGFTDESGELRVEWLLVGEHPWSAFYKGVGISQGEFKIPKITEVMFVDCWLEKDGERVNKWYPLKDTITFLMAIKNSGTTIIDHFTMKLPMGEMSKALKIKLLHPSIPSWLWSPFAEMLIGELNMGREIAIKDERLEMTNLFTPHTWPREIVLRTSIMGGIRPGETVVIGEKVLYLWWVEEYMENKGSELGTEITTEVIDKENGIVHMLIKEYKLGPFTFHDIKAELQLKGRIEKAVGAVELYVDDKLYDTFPWGANMEWL